MTQCLKCRRLVICANGGKNQISHDYTKRESLPFLTFCPPQNTTVIHTLCRKNNSGFFTCLSSLGPEREPDGGNWQSPPVKCYCRVPETSQWRFCVRGRANGRTHTKTSLCSWADGHWPAAASHSIDVHCASSNRNLLQKPVTEPRRPKQN